MASRRKFLSRLAQLQAASFVAPPVMNAQSSQPSSPAGAPRGAVFVPPEGSRATDPTAGIKVRVSGRDTGGAMTVLEVPTQIDAGAPLHVHRIENEWFYALRGEYDIQVGKEIFHLKPGGSVFAPRLIPHTWHDVGETAGTLLVVAEPAGHMEAFIVDLAQLNAQPQPPSADAMKAMFAKHEMEIVGPPLPTKQRK